MKHAFSPEFSITNYLDMVQQFVGLFLSKEPRLFG